MNQQKYMYNVNFPEYDQVLCAIETRALFGTDLKEKVFFSSVKVQPSISPYLKNRLEVACRASTFEQLLSEIERNHQENSKVAIRVKYVKLASGDPYAADRKLYCNKVLSRLGINEIGEDAVLYGLTFYNENWYFGKLVKNSGDWRKHNKRPHTFSNSLKINMAKVLVNIAGQGDTKKKIIDPCCGAGTVLLEACFAGYDILGSDINSKMVRSAKGNLNHFGYKATVTHQGIEEIMDDYDASIVDLPYGLYSKTSKEAQVSIIKNAKRISKTIVIISSEDIATVLEDEGLKLVDSCKYLKSVNRSFIRYIWVCRS